MKKELTAVLVLLSSLTSWCVQTVTEPEHHYEEVEDGVPPEWDTSHEKEPIDPDWTDEYDYECDC